MSSGAGVQVEEGMKPDGDSEPQAVQLTHHAPRVRELVPVKVQVPVVRGPVVVNLQLRVRQACKTELWSCRQSCGHADRVVVMQTELWSDRAVVMQTELWPCRQSCGQTELWPRRESCGQTELWSCRQSCGHAVRAVVRQSCGHAERAVIMQTELWLCRQSCGHETELWSISSLE